jgi:hypothetical protein
MAISRRRMLNYFGKVRLDSIQRTDITRVQRSSVLVLKFLEPRPKLLSARASIGRCAPDNVFGMWAGHG